MVDQKLLSYTEFVSRISFTLIQPKDRNRKVYRKIAELLARYNIYMDMINTRIPLDDGNMKKKLRGLTKMPRMSTIAIGAVINRGVSAMAGDQSFVNVGVWHGFTLLCGMIGNQSKKCIGIDNFSEFGGPQEAFLKRFNSMKGPRHLFYEMDYVEYFEKIHKDQIGFYMYDGNHNYDNQLRGLQMAEPFLAPNCIVLVDDINLKDAREGTLEFLRSSGAHYKVILDQETHDNFHPTWWNGIMVLQKVS